MRAFVLLLLLAGNDPTIGELEELAVWCADNKLFARLHDLYARILVLEPDHERARRRLGYTRKKGGPWVQTRGPENPKDLNVGALEEYESRRRAIAARYAERVLGPVESGDAVEDEAKAITDRVLALDPDHARARELRGEVREGQGWELAETAAARDRVDAWRAAASAARESATGGRPGTLTAGEQALGVTFAGILRTPELRVASPVSMAELPDLMRVAGAARSFHRTVLGAAPPVGRLTLLVLAKPTDYATVLREHPKLPDGLRRSSQQRSSVWVPTTETVLLLGESTHARREVCARVVIDRLNLGAFGLEDRTGWAWEGLGLYLGCRVTGRRSEAVAGRSRYGRGRRPPAAESKLWSRMMKARRNWFFESHNELRAGRSMELALLLQKDARTMRARDLLFAYALVAYLAESKQDHFARILRKIGGGADSAVVLTDELGVSLRTLELRLAQWVAERAAFGDGSGS
ncbi:MAG: hypothetical protein ACYTHK_14000 [Planctomycetota bacterium]|jgi:hypothetical protein